jgi:hypothetical protein
LGPDNVYPGNHPPEYNLHRGTATYTWSTIDSYRQELSILSQYGRPQAKVFLSETGYNLGNAAFTFEGYPAIGEDNRAEYMQRAFRDDWAAWPEVIGVAPYELNDPLGRPEWQAWDFLLGERVGERRMNGLFDHVVCVLLEVISVSPVFTLCIMITASGLNSAITCLQAPHGGMGLSRSVTIATAVISLSP